MTDTTNTEAANAPKKSKKLALHVRLGAAAVAGVCAVALSAITDGVAGILAFAVVAASAAAIIAPQITDFYIRHTDD